MKPNPDIYVIIVTYNGRQWVDKCFGSLRDSSLPLHVLVVDNCSTDGTPDFIEQNFPEVILIKSTENLGFGRGNNLGIKYALELGSDYFFLLNQDAWIYPQTVERLVACDDNRFGIISPTHFDGTCEVLDREFARYLFGSRAVRDISEKELLDGFKHPRTVAFVNAAAWLLPRATIEKVGGFDPFFFHYGEDNNYCDRVLCHGLKIIVVPDSIICHDRQCANKPMRTTWIARYLLIVYADPRRSLLSATCRSLLKQIGFVLKIGYYFLSGRRDDALCIVRAYKNLFGRRSELQLSRKVNKKQGPNWLHN